MSRISISSSSSRNRTNVLITLACAFCLAFVVMLSQSPHGSLLDSIDPLESAGSDDDVNADDGGGPDPIDDSVSGDESLPRGSLEALEKQLSALKAKEALLKEKVASAKDQSSQTLDAMLADGKLVAKTGETAKMEKLAADHAIVDRVDDLKEVIKLEKKVAREELEAKRIKEHINATLTQEADEKAALAKYEDPIKALKSELDASNLQSQKDSMNLAESETTLSHLKPETKEFTEEKTDLKKMIDEVKDEGEKKRGLELRIHQLEMLAAKLPIVDAAQVQSELFTENAESEKIEKEEEESKEEEADKEEEAKKLVGEEEKFRQESLTSLKMAQEEQKQLNSEMAKHSSAAHDQKSVISELRQLEHQKRLLERAIELHQTTPADPDHPHETIAADSVDRAAAHEMPPAGSGPLAAEMKAEKEKKAMEAKREEEAKQAAAVIDEAMKEARDSGKAAKH